GAGVVRDLRRARDLDGLRPQAADDDVTTSRRAFLARASALGMAAFLRPIAARAAEAKLPGYPFALGVASGSPRADSVVLWTRLAVNNTNGGGLDPVAVDVRWEVAEDEGFRKIVRKGIAVAAPERAHALHVEVDGLAAARGYHYRFIAGGEAS